MSDGGEDQAAEEAFMGQKKAKNPSTSVWEKSRLARAALPLSAPRFLPPLVLSI